MKYESRRSVRVSRGIVMRGVEFRSHEFMIVDFIEAAICKGSRLGMIFNFVFY